MLGQACSHRWEFEGSAPQNFVVPWKICFKHIIKTKILPPKMYFAPTNLTTSLRNCAGSQIWPHGHKTFIVTCVETGYLNKHTVCARMNYRKKMKAEHIRLIPWKLTSNLELLILLRWISVSKDGSLILVTNSTFQPWATCLKASHTKSHLENRFFNRASTIIACPQDRTKITRNF